MKLNHTQIEMYGKMLVALQYIEGCREFASIIPEVRTNLVYAKPDPQRPEDVLGIDGRITVINGMPYAAGRPKFGASSHMARLIIELSKIDPSIRAGINFASNPHLVKWLKEHCRNKGWTFSVIDRTKEPDEIKEKEGASMPWKVKEAIKAAGDKVPKVFYETGAVGKEDVAVIVGRDPIEVAKEVCEIARLYSHSFQPPQKVGKIDLDTFTSFILQRLGKKDETVIVPPLTGVDAGVIDIGNDKVLIIAEDPIFSLPKQPLEMFGWYTVHIGASDVAVMGVKPRYMSYTLLMPPQTSEEDFKTIIDSIHRTAVELEITIVGGHTGYYPGFAAPTIGGITVFAIADKDSYVTPAGAKPGDDVILTKGPAIETAGILAVLREEELLERYSPELVEKAKALCKQMTVVKDALSAMEAGGVTAMHDATEGGVIGGLFEIANASNVGMEIDESSFIYPEEVKMVCEAFNIDAISAIAEGSLLITARPTHSEKIIRRLKKVGIDASVVGKVTDDPKTRIMRRLDGSIVPLAIPDQDPFWPVFFEGLEQNGNKV
jgi:hydrogenase maturation factor/predicted fused transcriptional regulator/phosphomethylpyrimidine kinase